MFCIILCPAPTAAPPPASVPVMVPVPQQQQTRQQTHYTTQQYHTTSTNNQHHQQQQPQFGTMPMSGMQTLPSGTTSPPPMVMAAGQAQTLPHNMGPGMVSAQVWTLHLTTDLILGRCFTPIQYRGDAYLGSAYPSS